MNDYDKRARQGIYKLSRAEILLWIIGAPAVVAALWWMLAYR
jgi:hypothetical protein